MVDKKMIVTMTIEELEKLIFDTVTSANGNLYDGISSRYLKKNERNVKDILDELRQINERLDAMEKPKTRRSKKKVSETNDG